MIIHPMNVANILEHYKFDDNVVAAGYLHDVVEDTKYELSDIKEKFGDDIASLVAGASEPDKSLSWEDRKQHTIDTIKTMDIRHKAIVCADKISNLEDLKIMFEINGNHDFSAFKRGFDSQKWYYTEIYNSLIYNEDVNFEMFTRLKELIDYLFYDKKDKYVEDIVFDGRSEEFKILNKLHYQKEELFKLKELLETIPYVIEFTGTPRTGKTTLINNLYDFFKKKGFSVDVLEEFTTSKKYKKEIYPLLKDKYKNIVNTEIPKYVLNQLEESINNKPDIIIVDRSLFDRLIWVDRLNLKDGMSDSEYLEYKKLYIPLIKDKIDIIIATYTDSLTSIKRDYSANLSLEKRSFLNEANVDEYNRSLLNMKDLAESEQQYTDTLVDQSISALQRANEQAATQRQEQIDLAQAQYDWWSEHDAIHEAEQLVDGSLLQIAHGIDPINTNVASRLGGTYGDNIKAQSQTAITDWYGSLRTDANLATIFQGNDGHGGIQGANEQIGLLATNLTGTAGALTTNNRYTSAIQKQFTDLSVGTDYIKTYDSVLDVDGEIGSRIRQWKDQWFKDNGHGTEKDLDPENVDHDSGTGGKTPQWDKINANSYEGALAGALRSAGIAIDADAWINGNLQRRWATTNINYDQSHSSPTTVYMSFDQKFEGSTDEDLTERITESIINAMDLGGVVNIVRQ